MIETISDIFQIVTLFIIILFLIYVFYRVCLGHHRIKIDALEASYYQENNNDEDDYITKSDE